MSTASTTPILDTSMVRRERPAQAVIPAADITPQQMLAIAVQQGADLEKLEKLMDLRDRWEATEARKAFVCAMADFKAEPLRIFKSRQVNIPGGAKFAHATLADVCDGVVATLSRFGLSHSWELKQLENGWPQVTCVITHEKGHSERTALSAPPDDSGKKNSIQQIASTLTYLERYTLMAACGLAAKDIDNDGNGAKDKKADEPPPEGYDNWHADMTALASEGLTKLTAAWGAEGSAKYRRYVIKFDEPWWLDLKKRAEKVKVPE